MKFCKITKKAKEDVSRSTGLSDLQGQFLGKNSGTKPIATTKVNRVTLKKGGRISKERASVK